MCEGMCFFFLCWPLEDDRPRELHHRVYTAKSTARKGARCQVPDARCPPLPAARCSPATHVLKRLPQAALPPAPPPPPNTYLVAVEPGQRRTLRSSCTLHRASLHCPLACFLLSFARRSAGSRVRPKLASCRAPSRTLILHLRTFADLLMAAPRREMSDRPTVCQSLRATRPSSQPLPSGYCHPFALFLSIPWRAFRSSTAAPGVSMGKPASIWLARAKRPGQPRMPQNRPWQADLLQESPRNPVLLDGCMQPHLMVRLGRSSLKHMSH
jgi:hypothetical protein